MGLKFPIRWPYLDFQKKLGYPDFLSFKIVKLFIDFLKKEFVLGATLRLSCHTGHTQVFKKVLDVILKTEVLKRS